MWVMTSKRTRGTRENPPYVEFAIGAVRVATILMNREGKESDWTFDLDMQGLNLTGYKTFGDALKELHNLLNSPPPEGFEVFAKKGAVVASGAPELT